MGRSLAAFILTLAMTLPVQAEPLTVAAASDLRYALDDMAEVFRADHPDIELRIIYGSSGRMKRQISNGAPFDVFLSADIAFPEQLYRDGHGATEPEPYAIGRIVVWSPNDDAQPLTLADLNAPGIRRVAIAQPQHAPYGQRAVEALQSSGLWEAIEPRLVYGDNIAQTARMVAAGGAEAGIIALSLARFPELERHGYHLIDADLHSPLKQGFLITARAADNHHAQVFAEFLRSPQARHILADYGFEPPEGND